MVHKIVRASIALSIVLFLLFIVYLATSPFVVPSILPAATVIGILLLALFIYFAHATEGK